MNWRTSGFWLILKSFNACHPHTWHSGPSSGHPPPHTHTTTQPACMPHGHRSTCKFFYLKNYHQSLVKNVNYHLRLLFFLIIHHHFIAKITNSHRNLSLAFFSDNLSFRGHQIQLDAKASFTKNFGDKHLLSPIYTFCHQNIEWQNSGVGLVIVLQLC